MISYSPGQQLETGPQADTSQLLTSVNKVLLELTHMHSFTHMWQLQHCNSKTGKMQQTLLWPTEPETVNTQAYPEKACQSQAQESRIWIVSAILIILLLSANHRNDVLNFSVPLFLYRKIYKVEITAKHLIALLPKFLHANKRNRCKNYYM